MDELGTLSDYMGNARHQLFIMDSCYGGLLAATRASIVNPKIPDYLNNITDRAARQVITAGGKGQQVLDGGPKGHSFFVDYFLEALAEGKADTDGDGYITFNELTSYLIPRASNRLQTPAAGVLPGHQAGEYVFRSPQGRLAPVISSSAPVTGPVRAPVSSPAATLPQPNERVENNAHSGSGSDARSWVEAVRSYANAGNITRFNQQIAGAMSPVLHGRSKNDAKPGDKQIELQATPGLGLWAVSAELEVQGASDTIFVLNLDRPLGTLLAGSIIEFHGLPLPLTRNDLPSQKSIGKSRNPGGVYEPLTLRFNVHREDVVLRERVLIRQ
jgi:hypothetical protein